MTAALRPLLGQVFRSQKLSGIFFWRTDVYQAVCRLAQALQHVLAPGTQARVDLPGSISSLAREGSVPRLGSDSMPTPVAELQAQASVVAATMATASARAVDLRPTDRVKALLGAQFPVLPRFTVADPVPLRASLAGRATLCAGDDLAPGEVSQAIHVPSPGAGGLTLRVTAPGDCSPANDASTSAEFPPTDACN